MHPHHRTRSFLPQILRPVVPREDLILGAGLDFLARGLLERALAGVQHLALGAAALDLDARRDRRVAAEALAHVDLPALALAVAVAQLQASRRQRLIQRRPQAVDRLVARHHDTVAVLKALGERGAWGREPLVIWVG